MLTLGFGVVVSLGDAIFFMERQNGRIWERGVNHALERTVEDMTLQSDRLVQGGAWFVVERT